MVVHSIPFNEEDHRRAKEMLDLVNKAREENGLGALQLHEMLCKVAKAHAIDMRARAYQAHSTPEGVDVAARVTNAGIMWRSVGENLAGGPTHKKGDVIFTGYPSLGTAHQGLMESPNHRANILGDFEFVGFGFDRNKDGTLIVVEVFATL